MSLRARLASFEGRRTYARALFATIADRYDLITVVLSFGRDLAWKRRLLRLAAARPGSRVLDLATGTGDIAFLLEDAGARVIGLDVTWRMLQLAVAKRPAHAGPSFVSADMMALPFVSSSFEVVTTGYGLRNAPDLGRALDEIARVLKPGGQLVSLDFERPAHPVIRSIYFAYLGLVGGALGWLLHRDPDTYRYIPASIRRYPDAAGLRNVLHERGFDDVTRFRVLGGLLAIHRARLGVRGIR
ncbi:MAG: ubiquinone/menaquinone biosynthesis methyltransferase [Vicinamibacterales bacterium]